MPLSGAAKITTLPAHGINAPGNGKIVNLPVGNKGNNFKPVDHDIEPTGTTSRLRQHLQEQRS